MASPHQRYDTARSDHQPFNSWIQNALCNYEVRSKERTNLPILSNLWSPRQSVGLRCCPWFEYTDTLNYATQVEYTSKALSKIARPVVVWNWKIRCTSKPTYNEFYTKESSSPFFPTALELLMRRLHVGNPSMLMVNRGSSEKWF